MTPGLAAVELLRVRVPYRRPFRTSFGTTTHRDCVLVRAIGTDGVDGWGECTAMEWPGYSSEWTDAAWLVLRDHLVPPTLGGPGREIRGHPMAKAALDVALTDLDLRRRGLPLAKHLGGVRDRIPCGVSLGIEERLDDLLALVNQFVEAGYRRVKVKIEPGRDVEVVRAVREAFPATPLSVDANAAYTMENARALLDLDDFGLKYIEQPFPEDDLLGHIELQRRMATPLCLDETISSARMARGAIELGACRIINVKLGRIGGLDEALRIHDVAREAGVPLWVGGMLETGVGRAANVALASLPGFTLPGDTSASHRYFEEDLTPSFVVDADGTMAVPDGPGLGVAPLPDRLEAAVVDRTTVWP